MLPPRLASHSPQESRLTGRRLSVGSRDCLSWVWLWRFVIPAALEAGEGRSQVEASKAVLQSGEPLSQSKHLKRGVSGVWWQSIGLLCQALSSILSTVNTQCPSPPGLGFVLFGTGLSVSCPGWFPTLGLIEPPMAILASARGDWSRASLPGSL